MLGNTRRYMIMDRSMALDVTVDRQTDGRNLVSWQTEHRKRQS